MPRGGQVSRQWRILRLLEGASSGLRARDLHAALGANVSERTLYRDLRHLQDAGFPLYEEEGRWRVLRHTEGGYTIPVEPTELLALLLSEELLEPMRSAEIAGALEGLRDKVAAMLRPTGRDYAEELRNNLVASFTAPGEYARRAEQIRRIEDAIHRQHRIWIRYQGSDRHETERTVDPYLLWFADGRLYLVGWCHLRTAVRTFAIGRVDAVDVLDEAFEPSPAFDARVYTNVGFGAWHGEPVRVVLEFTRPIAHLTRERRFHDTQRIEPLPGGGALVTMDVAGLPRIASWVAGFGGLVIVRSPRELVERVRSIHQRGVAAYEP